MPRAMPHNLACPGLTQRGYKCNLLGSDCLLQATSNLYLTLQGKVPFDLANRPGNEDVTSLLVEACIDWQMALRRAPARHSS